MLALEGALPCQFLEGSISFELIKRAEGEHWETFPSTKVDAGSRWGTDFTPGLTGRACLAGAAYRGGDGVQRSAVVRSF